MAATDHKWKGGLPKTGQSAICEKCGVTMYHQAGNHVKVFTLPGTTLRQNQRPACVIQPTISTTAPTQP